MNDYEYERMQRLERKVSELTGAVNELTRQRAALLAERAAGWGIEARKRADAFEDFAHYERIAQKEREEYLDETARLEDVQRDINQERES